MNNFWTSTKQTFKEKLGKGANDSTESPELRDRTRVRNSLFTVKSAVSQFLPNPFSTNTPPSHTATETFDGYLHETESSLLLEKHNST